VWVENGCVQGGVILGEGRGEFLKWIRLWWRGGCRRYSGIGDVVEIVQVLEELVDVTGCRDGQVGVEVSVELGRSVVRLETSVVGQHFSTFFISA